MKPMERLNTLASKAKTLLSAISETPNPEKANGFYSQLLENLQEQNEILKQQVENLKRQIK